MDCQIAQNSLSAHLDGRLSEGRRGEVLEHLGQCPDCNLRLRQLSHMRSMVRRLPAPAVPAELTGNLRVMASRERARVVARQNPLVYWSNRLQLFLDNLMRPLALPFAGGLVSAMVMFSMLMPSIRLRIDPKLNDIPLAPIRSFCTDPTVKEQTNLGIYNYDEFLPLEVAIDEGGRAYDYEITGPGGSELLGDPRIRRGIESELLYTRFNPATTYGRPTAGKMKFVLSRQKIEVSSKS